MKTSNKLLLLLLVAFLAATLGNNLMLKNQYDKVKTANPTSPNHH